MTYAESPWFIIELGLLCVAIILPLSVHAGFFSMFFDTAVADTIEPIVYIDDANIQTMPLLKAAIHSDPNPAKGGGDILIEDGALVPARDIDGKNTTINTKTVNGEISIYIVRENDTPSEIASMFDISLKTLLWANDIKNANLIRPGDSLIILPITGVRHVVKKGDTLKSIVKKYLPDADSEEINSTIEDAILYNQLASAEGITVGDTVIIPNGIINTPAPTKNSSPSKSSGGTLASGGGSSGFTNPLPGARRTQGIHGYNGVDLAAPAGTPVVAAAGGSVIVARGSGWNGGYGLYVVVKHANGTQTLYAHLSRTAVAVGNTVVAGQVIGYVGNTGRSTGDHLHFEVRGARNPF